MVLDTLKKTLSTVTDKAIHPVDTLTKTSSRVKKKIIGPDTDIIKETSEYATYVPVLQQVEKLYSTHEKQIKKSTISAKKKTLYVASQELLFDLVEKEKDYKKKMSLITRWMNRQEKALKDWHVISSYTAKWFVTTSAKLSSADITFLLPLFQELMIDSKSVMWSTHKKVSIEKRTDQQKQFHKKTKKLIDQLINHEYVVTKEQKKLVYHLQALVKYEQQYKAAQRARRKGEDEKQVVRKLQYAKKKIYQLIDKEIPENLKLIDKAIKPVQRDEKKIQIVWEDFMTSSEQQNKQFFKQLKEEKASLAKAYATFQKDTKQWKKKIDMLIKKSLASQTKISSAGSNVKDIIGWKTTWLKACEQHMFWLDHIHAHVVAYLASITTEVDMYELYLDMLSLVSDEEKSFSMSISMLSKERIMQLKLLLRLKRQHVDLSKKAVRMMSEMTDSLTDSFEFGTMLAKIKLFQKEFIEQKKNYEKQIGELRSLVSDQKKTYKDSLVINEYAHFSKQYLILEMHQQILNEYGHLLEDRLPNQQTYVTKLHEVVGATESYIEQLEKEQKILQSWSDLSTKQKKQIEKNEEGIHQAEKFLATLETYLENEEQITDEWWLLVKKYAKWSKQKNIQRDFFKKHAWEKAKKAKMIKKVAPYIVLPLGRKGMWF